MNALTGHAETAHAASSVAMPPEQAEAGAEPTLHTLRRTGHKAIRFTGWQIVEARGTGDAGTMWYDLAIYRSVAQAIIVELIARRSAMDEQDTSRVEVFTTLADAASWLEAHQCANDVPIPPSLSSGDGPMATSVLQAVQLRQRIARIRDEYHGLLSEVFEALDITDTDMPSGNAAVAA